MLLDTGPVFDNRISLGTILQCGIWITTALAVLGRKFWQTDKDSQSVIKLNELVEKSGHTQAQLANTQTLQQTLIDNIAKTSLEARQEHKEQMAELRKDHHERIQRLEDQIFFHPAKQRGQARKDEPHG